MPSRSLNMTNSCTDHKARLLTASPKTGTRNGTTGTSGTTGIFGTSGILLQIDLASSNKTRTCAPLFGEGCWRACGQKYNLKVCPLSSI